MVSATVSDQSNPDNCSKLVSLSSKSKTAGLAVQVMNPNGQPVSVGRACTQESVYLFDSTQGGVFNVPLGFRYIRTGDLTAGSANALVGTTFSYQ